MPATAEQVAQAVLDDALAGIKSAQSDGQSVELFTPEERLNAAAQAEAAQSGLSGWGGVLRARVVPPGAQ